MTLIKSLIISCVSIFFIIGFCPGNLSAFAQNNESENYPESVQVMIRSVKYDFDDKQVIGKINKGKKSFSSRGMDRIVGFEGVMDLYVVEAFEKTYIDAVEERSLKKNTIGIFIPKIIFLPIIKDLNFELKGKDLSSYAGKCSMECVWEIYTIADKQNPVARIPIQTVFQRPKGMNDYIMTPLLKEASRSIASIDTLKDFLYNLESDYLENTKGEIIHIQKSGYSNIEPEDNIIKQGIQAVVTINHDDVIGSGIIISSNGYIATNYHVVKDAEEINIRTNEKKEFKAEIIKTNPDFDLALLKIDTDSLPSLPFGDSDLIEIGDDVYAIGTPFSNRLSQSVSRGIISGIRTMSGIQLIQTDVPINQGNSGGALINNNGHIIGIPSWKINYYNTEGIGFCIPSNTIIEMLNLKMD